MKFAVLHGVKCDFRTLGKVCASLGLHVVKEQGKKHATLPALVKAIVLHYCPDPEYTKEQRKDINSGMHHIIFTIF